MAKTVRAKILLVDDDALLLKGAEMLLRKDYEVLSASSVQDAKAVLRATDIDAIITDLNFEGQDYNGIDLIDWVLKEYSGLPIVVLSGDSSTHRVVQAMRRPLVNFIPKSADYEMDLRVAINQALEQSRRLSEESFGFTFRTKSPVMKRVLEVVDRVASSATACNILVTGETGSGKEVLAKHFAARASRKLITANMASIPRDMVESQLFGHSRGAFTGAHADQVGLITQAHRNIFFLDEIGECLLETQAKLLRAVQEKEITPLGSSRTVKVDVRFLAATNRNLNLMVERGEFRLDLLQRLNAVTLHIPALRERPEDIEFLALRFLAEFSADNHFSIKASGIEALLEHAWPGNTRELENVIRKIVILSDRSELDGDSVRDALQENGLNIQGRKRVSGELDKLKGDILSALERHEGNQALVAEELDMHRSTLFRWRKRFGILDTKIGKASSISRNTGDIA